MTYPVGTVLMCPRGVVSNNDNSRSESSYYVPQFIVFRSCPVSLLRGAVSVGRVLACRAANLRSVTAESCHLTSHYERILRRSVKWRAVGAVLARQTLGFSVINLSCHTSMRLDSSDENEILCLTCILLIILWLLFLIEKKTSSYFDKL